MRKYTLRDNIISVLIGVAIGIPICIYANYERTHREPVYYIEETQSTESSLFVGATEAGIPDLSEYETEIVENIEDTEDQIAEENYLGELDLLASCVEAEAGNQGLEGKRLVVDVILNRVDDPEFPDTIEGVITQPYHFSTYWNGMIDKADPTEETFEAIRLELEDRSYPGIYYFTAGGYGNYGTPWRQIGDHYFCTK